MPLPWTTSKNVILSLPPEVLRSADARSARLPGEWVQAPEAVLVRFQALRLSSGRRPRVRFLGLAVRVPFQELTRTRPYSPERNTRKK